MAKIGYDDVKDMDVADLYALNKSIVELIKVKNRERELRAGADFSTGDVAKFDSAKAGRTVYIVVDTVLPKSLHGLELLADGSKGTLKWRVSPSICVKTTKADAMDAMKPKVVTPPPSVLSTAPYMEEDEEEEKPVAKPAVPEPVAEPGSDRPSTDYGSDW
jgi:hypothetical protein